MRICRYLPLLLLWLSVTAQAASVASTADFYQGSAPVDSRSQERRLTATREALVEVLVRMTGNVSVSMSDKASLILQDAPRFVRSYRYVEREPVTAQTAAGRQPYLVVDFDGAALTRALKDNGLPLWDAERPVTVVWLLAPGEDGARSLQGRAAVEERFPSLLQVSQQRGIPLRLPEMDIQDRSAVSSMDVVAEDAMRLDAASRRYEGRHVLLVTLRQSTPNLWEAQWSFLREAEGPLRWLSLGLDPDRALASGMQQYADQLAREYALELAPGWVQSARVRLVGLPGIGGYARVMAYLQRLSLVDSVQPIEVLGNDMIFLVRFEGTLEDLQRGLELGDLLMPAPEESPAMDAIPSAPAIPGIGSTAVGAGPIGGSAETPAGLSFFAVSRRPELRYQLKP